MSQKTIMRVGAMIKSLAVLAVVSFSPALAQLTATSPVRSVNDAKIKILCVFRNWIFTIALVVSVILTLYAAFAYMTSEGNEEKVKTATKSLQYVAVGIAVAILAAGIPYIVGNFFNLTLGTIC